MSSASADRVRLAVERVLRHASKGVRPGGDVRPKLEELIRKLNTAAEEAEDVRNYRSLQQREAQDVSRKIRDATVIVHQCLIARH
jgi:hypothetical protein